MSTELDWLWYLVPIAVLIFYFLVRKRNKIIFDLIARGETEALKRLINQRPALIHFKTKFGATMLHLAAYKGNTDLVYFLLKQGADPEAVDYNGKRPIDIAYSGGQQKIVVILKDHTIQNSFRENLQKFDFFISYKSENVELARLIADQLIASGKKIWFAEYEVLLHKREKFQQAIDNGLKQSNYGVALTNNLYARSPYCSIEIAGLLEHCGSDKVFEIKVPNEVKPHINFPDLHNCASIESNNITDILNFLSKKTNSSITSVISLGRTKENLYKGICNGVSFSFDTKGWKLTKKGQISGADVGEGVEFKFKAVYVDLFMNLYFGLDKSPEGATRLTKPKTDDRQLYNELIEYAKKHMFTVGAEIKGVHLLFKDGFGQLALTYWNNSYWTRKYSVTILHPKLNVPVEFVFTFGFSGNFNNYCHHVHLMDSLVWTLQWDH